MNIGKFFETGKIGSISNLTKAETIEFCPHKAFKGVYLKHLVTGDKTGNKISCHLVKVEPYCVLDTHVHNNSLEIHEVIYGGGICYIAGNKIEYKIGTVGVIPEKTEHKVTTGKDGIYILAKFSPALL